MNQFNGIAIANTTTIVAANIATVAAAALGHRGSTRLDNSLLKMSKRSPHHEESFSTVNESPCYLRSYRPSEVVVRQVQVVQPGQGNDLCCVSDPQVSVWMMPVSFWLNWLSGGRWQAFGAISTGFGLQPVCAG
ncbi:hypothetical protein Plim_0699 [Planctopirus limnophila DSM 3776]|uniref:Uncharacterized protein n=2 Tax=Planctopirus TaxID=1649480 RepID=D5SRL2_PLAL2|nr:MULTISPECIES: hypothetical protein [Planctopirus]ADG66546.1 hypothetical protein Plim_0699 [Planctopirus limnophila DSM 3776]QDV29570.1 hypothetical protein Spb1_14820 [Planctopirus ephydatiae]